MKILSTISILSSLWLVIAVFSPSLRGLDAIGMRFFRGQ